MNGFTVKFEFVNELEGIAQAVRTEGGWVVQVNQWKFDAFDDDTQRFILLHEFQHVMYEWRNVCVDCKPAPIAPKIASKHYFGR